MNVFILFQIPIFLLLLIGAYQDYRTRTVSNKILFYIAIVSIPIVFIQYGFVTLTVLGIIFLYIYRANIVDSFDKKIFILLIIGMSIPIVLIQNLLLIPVILSILFLNLFYFTNQIGGADTKVFILLLIGMTTNEIFIFFFLFSVANLILIFRFWKGIPLFISILFGYFGVILLSFLPILIRITFGE